MSQRSADDAGGEALARLILAAAEDAEFRKRLLFVLRLPLAQRQPMIRTAVDEMRLRGEPAEIRAAFMALSSDEGAHTALKLLESK
jgi:hypothetical protein